MNKTKFELLRLVDEFGRIDLDAFSIELFKKKEVLNNYIDWLNNNGYICNNHISDKGCEYLNQHKIDNAIILAAGMSTRFVPLSYEIPKGLLDVNGTSLIERQIMQLHEKGIENIIIVVGYMKEKFEFLKDKYHVILVENPEYQTRNNHSSIYVAREYLKNTIITSSDLYFTENIFQKYAFDSYYCSIFKEGSTDERGLTLDDDDKILETFYGEKSKDVWVTLGYAYFSKSFSQKMIDILTKDYYDEKIYNKFWADIQDDHLSELYMYAKKCRSDVINEFDSLEELRLFDKKYLTNSNSKIMQKITKILGVGEDKIVNIKTLKNIKMSLFKFDCNNITYLCDVDDNVDFNNEILYDRKVYKYYKSSKKKDVNLFK